MTSLSAFFSSWFVAPNCITPLCFIIGRLLPHYLKTGVAPRNSLPQGFRESLKMESTPWNYFLLLLLNTVNWISIGTH